MIRILSLSIILIIAMSSFSQSKKDIILKIDDNQYTTEEFEAIYKKNNSNLPEEADIKSPKEYMDLYINFKLKVLAAQELGLDTLKSFKTELKGYRDDLAKTYLTDIDFNEEMLKTAYHRTKYERKASHILVKLESENDTITAYNKIIDIRNKIIKGADFHQMAYQYSDDPSAKKNKGELGYFQAFQMVFPFEEAAYKTPVGDISQPIRTRFGYHILKVEDERESKGQMSVAHIMKRIPRDQHHGGSGNDEHIAHLSLKLKSELDSIRKLVLNGADFADLAKENSDDKHSAKQGGKMPLFTESRMIPSFAKTSFALKNDGDISQVIQTQYGWHLIKRLKHIPVSSFEDLKDQLTENIKKNPQISVHSKEAFIKKLKKEYNFKLFDENFALLNDNYDSISNINGSEKTLFSFADKSYTINNFMQSQFKPEKNTITESLDNFIESELNNYEDSKLEVKYPDFRNLMREYHDGILLFNISEKLIWNKASEDTLGLKSFYEKNKTNYLTTERFKGWIIKCDSFETRSKLDEILGEHENISKEELLTVINTDREILSIEDGIYEKGNNAIVDFYVWKKEKPAKLNELTTYVRGEELEPAPKKLKNSRGLHIAEYQKELENQWIEKLRTQHKIEIKKKQLKKIESLK